MRFGVGPIWVTLTMHDAAGILATKLYPGGSRLSEKNPDIRLHVLLSPPHTPHSSSLSSLPTSPSHPTGCDPKRQRITLRITSVEFNKRNQKAPIGRNRAENLETTFSFS